MRMLAPLFRAMRRHERAWVAAFLGGFVALLILLALGTALDLGGRIGFFRPLESAILAWDEHWMVRLEGGEALLAEGRAEEAALLLEDLNREFPARTVRFKRDRERERLLRALGRAHLSLERKRRSLTAFLELVAFDPRNYENHYALAMAQLHFREDEAATDSLIACLAIHPTFLPARRALAEVYYERGAFRAVADTFEGYLFASQFETMSVALGATEALFEATLDGRFHDYELRLEFQKFQPGSVGDLRLNGGGHFFEVESLQLVPPVAAGKRRAATTSLWPAGASGESLLRPEDGQHAIQRKVPVMAGEVATVRLRARWLKAYDAELWRFAERSYRRLLDPSGFELAEALWFRGDRDVRDG